MNVKVGSQTSGYQMMASNSKLHSWETYGEDTTALQDSSTFTTLGLVEQLNVTRDSSDYLWCTTRLVYLLIFNKCSYLHFDIGFTLWVNMLPFLLPI